jgi:hypothetical protein
MLSWLTTRVVRWWSFVRLLVHRSTRLPCLLAPLQVDSTVTFGKGVEHAYVEEVWRALQGAKTLQHMQTLIAKYDCKLCVTNFVCGGCGFGHVERFPSPD